jgi:hypothetical protein
MRRMQAPHTPFIPAKAGIQKARKRALALRPGVPAFAGTSGERVAFYRYRLIILSKRNPFAPPVIRLRVQPDDPRAIVGSRAARGGRTATPCLYT